MPADSFWNKFTSKFDELFGIDIRALALMRILFSLCILIDLYDHFPYIKMLFTDDGLLPRTYVIKMLNPHTVSLNLMSGSWGFQVFLFSLLALFTIGLLAGYRTRICTFAVWILFFSLHNRNYFLLGAEDKLMDILFFFFLFLPWGACYSLDSRAQQNSPPARVSSMGSFAYLLQVSFFYSFAGLIKSDPIWTVQGTALYYVMSIHEFAKPSAGFLLHYPAIMHAMNYFVLWLERCGSLLFFIPFKNLPFRLLGVAAYMLFHIGIILTMELRLFQWICLIMLIGFLPTKFLNIFLPSVQPPKTKASSPLFIMPAYLSLIPAFFIVYIFFWNLGELYPPLAHIPPNLRWIGYTFNVRQHWGMFGPAPMKDDGWMVMPGKLRDGKIVDVYKQGAPLTWDEPASIPKLDRMYHLTLYNLNLRDQANFDYREPWAQYICREWNTSHPYNQRLVAFDIDFMLRTIPPPGQKPAPKRTLLISHYCDLPNNRPLISVFKNGDNPTP